MECVDMSLDKGYSGGQIKLRSHLWKEYQKILHKKDLFWYRRAWMVWLKFSDRNSRFFHISRTNRKRRNVIQHPTLDDGKVIHDLEEIKEAIQCYFSTMFEDDDTPTDWAWKRLFLSLMDDELNLIQSISMDHEIKAIIFSMGPIKLSGIDRLHSILFQSQ